MPSYRQLGDLTTEQDDVQEDVDAYNERVRKASLQEEADRDRALREHTIDIEPARTDAKREELRRKRAQQAIIAEEIREMVKELGEDG